MLNKRFEAVLAPELFKVGPDDPGREIGGKIRLHHERKPRPFDPGVEVDDIHAPSGKASRDSLDIAGGIVAKDGQNKAFAIGYRRWRIRRFGLDHGHRQVETLAIRGERSGQGFGTATLRELDLKDDREIPAHDRLT